MKHILNYTDFSYLIKENAQKIMWTNTIEVFLAEFTLNERIKDKLTSLVMKYILNDVYPTYKDDISADDRKTYNGLDSYAKISYLCKSHRGLVNRAIQEKLASIQDFLLDENTDINIVKGLKTFDELYELSVEYHDNLDDAYISVRTDETEDTDKFIKYPNGWYWINLNVEYSVNEADNMGHCGRDAGKILFSLRDNEKQSHITVSYNPTEKALYQIKGRRNSKPLAKYHGYIIDMILNKKYEVKFMKNGTYRPELDFSLLDLPEEEQKELFKLKPSLELTDKMFGIYIKNRDYLGILSMVNNGYPGYSEYDIKLGTTNELNDFIEDCNSLKIDYKKLFKYCFDVIQAIEMKDLNIVKLCVSEGYDISFDYYRPFRYACYYGRYDIAKYLIEIGVDATVANNNAILCASESGYADIVQLLIENGADMTVEDNEPLTCAIRGGHIDVVKVLIKNGMDVSKNADYLKMSIDNFDMFKLLFENGAKPHYYHLRIAIRENKIQLVEFLLKNGIDVTENNNEAIKLAKTYGMVDMMELLKKYGAKL